MSPKPLDDVETVEELKMLNSSPHRTFLDDVETVEERRCWTSVPKPSDDVETKLNEDVEPLSLNLRWCWNRWSWRCWI